MYCKLKLNESEEQVAFIESHLLRLHPVYLCAKKCVLLVDCGTYILLNYHISSC